MDPVYVDSIPAVSRRFLALGEQVRSVSSPEAVFVAGPRYAPWIASLGGRRVLLLGSEADLPDDRSSRKRAHSWFLDSKDPAKIRAASAQWGLTHLAWGRLDSDVQIDYQFFESSPLFVEIWGLKRWVRVFEFRDQ
jgi:hypothetical protein